MIYRICTHSDIPVLMHHSHRCGSLECGFSFHVSFCILYFVPLEMKIFKKHNQMQTFLKLKFLSLAWSMESLHVFSPFVWMIAHNLNTNGSLSKAENLLEFEFRGEKRDVLLCCLVPQKLYTYLRHFYFPSYFCVLDLI